MNADYDKLYILEKVWTIDSLSFRFNENAFNYALIRPCNVSYKVYRDFSLGKNIKDKCIIHEGCIASWYASKTFNFGFKGPYEEFIVDVNVNKQVFPLIENWVIENNWRSYTVKTIDLKTGETLFDNTSNWFKARKCRTFVCR